MKDWFRGAKLECQESQSVSTEAQWLLTMGTLLQQKGLQGPCAGPALTSWVSVTSTHPTRATATPGGGDPVTPAGQTVTSPLGVKFTFRMLYLAPLIAGSGTRFHFQV